MLNYDFVRIMTLKDIVIILRLKKYKTDIQIINVELCQVNYEIKLNEMMTLNQKLWDFEKSVCLS